MKIQETQLIEKILSRASISIKQIANQKLQGRKSPQSSQMQQSATTFDRKSSMSNFKNSSMISQFTGSKQKPTKKGDKGNLRNQQQISEFSQSISQSIIDLQDSSVNNHDEFIDGTEFQSQNMGLQTNLIYPDTSFKDIGVSGFAGGSSSALARKDQNKQLYVPLKKRLMEKSSSQSKLLFETSTSSMISEMSKPGQMNVKKVQVNLGAINSTSNEGVKVLTSQRSMGNLNTARTKSSTKLSTSNVQQQQKKRASNQNNINHQVMNTSMNSSSMYSNQNMRPSTSMSSTNQNNHKQKSPPKVLIRPNQKNEVSNYKQQSINSKDRSSSAKKSIIQPVAVKIQSERDKTPVTKQKKQYEVMQIVVSLGESTSTSNLKPKKSLLGQHAKVFWRAYRKYKFSLTKQKIEVLLQKFELKQQILKEYRQFEDKITIVQKFYLQKQSKQGNKLNGTFKFNKNGKNLIKFIKRQLLAYYQGWKLRKVYQSKFVKNAITQYHDYQKFLFEMEMDPSVNEVMKKQFRSNLPRSKQQILDSINKLMSDPLWFSKISHESPVKIKPNSRVPRKDLNQKKNASKNQEFESERSSILKASENSMATTADIKPWWEQAAEKHKPKSSIKVKQNNKNEVKNNNTNTKSQADLFKTETFNSQNRDLTPQPQKSFLKRKANLKYDPLQNARDAKKQAKVEQKNMIQQQMTQLDGLGQSVADSNDIIAFDSQVSTVTRQLNNLNQLSENIKNEKSIDNMITTINRTIEKYELLIKEHQNQLQSMSQTQKLQQLMILQQANSPERMPFQRVQNMGYLNTSNQNFKNTQRTTNVRSPTTIHTTPGGLLTRESLVGSVNESVSIERSQKNEDFLRNLMPSQRKAFLKKKSQDEADLQQSMRHQRSSSNIMPSMSIGSGPFKEEKSHPKFTKTGLMLTPIEQNQKNSSQNRYKRTKPQNEMLQSKHQPPMQSIKESIDLSYLKKVKSKVDCWTSKLNNNTATIKITESIQKETKRQKPEMSPQKSPKVVEKSSISPLKNKSIDDQQNNSLMKPQKVNSRNSSGVRNMSTSPQQHKQKDLTVQNPKEQQKLTKTIKQLDKLRESIQDDEMCNQESPKNEMSTNKPELTVIDDELQERLQVLDQMNDMLRKLKNQFNQNEKVGKEVFEEILQSDFENVLINMKEEYAQMFQSNRYTVRTEQSEAQKLLQEL
ncbi:UNKNOWN [Stylonychia lemnae]|uniref:Uncharacterized protein n=1 Tax=Stylonychia lemnae TaxID=5949 RepID=A0A078AZI9_STYLE|nr:UNKNOWN [Stylonychia lemnae]|eukprot:CDW86223.1 UNKNOWN [Stylonychia lemnae]